MTAVSTRVEHVNAYGPDPFEWPPDTVYIGRRNGIIPASPLANMYSVGQYGRDQAIDLYRRWLGGALVGRDRGPREKAVQSTIARLAITPPTRFLCWCAPERCHGDIIVDALNWWRGHMRHVAVVGARPGKWQQPHRTQVLVENLAFWLPANICLVSGNAQGVDQWAEEAHWGLRHVVWSIPVTDDDYARHGRAAPLLRNTEVVNGCQAVVAIYNGRNGGTHDTVTKARARGLPVLVITPEPDQTDITPWVDDLRAMLAALPPIGDVR